MIIRLRKKFKNKNQSSAKRQKMHNLSLIPSFSSFICFSSFYFVFFLLSFLFFSSFVSSLSPLYRLSYPSLAFKLSFVFFLIFRFVSNKNIHTINTYPKKIKNYRTRKQKNKGLRDLKTGSSKK